MKLEPHESDPSKLVIRATPFSVGVGAERQLNASRYVVERLHFTAFAKSILAGELPENMLNEEMRKAMENYDQIMASAANGTYGETIEPMNRDFEEEYRKLIGKARIKAAAERVVNA